MANETKAGQGTPDGAVDLGSLLPRLVPGAAQWGDKQPIIAGGVVFMVPAYQHTPLLRWFWESPQLVFINAGCVIGNGYSTAPRDPAFTYVTMAFERGTGNFLGAVYP